jgi:hypothetical protein
MSTAGSKQETDTRPEPARQHEPLFRVWIADYRDWLPKRWNEVPPAAVALQPAEEGCLVAEKARAFLKGFNRQMLAEAKPLWAVALPVCVQYQGDAQPGQRIQGHQFSLDRSAAEAS